jgi:hypothetical protein
MDSQPDPDHVLLPVPLGNRVLQYLAGRPYAEVHELVIGLQQLAAPPAPDAPSTEPE